MTMILRQKETGFLYHYTKELAQRDDMETYVPPESGSERQKQLATIDEAPSATVKDWRKIVKKGDLAAFAKMNDGIHLDETQTMRNMQAQYVSALQAKQNGENVDAAVAAQASKVAGDAEDDE